MPHHSEEEVGERLEEEVRVKVEEGTQDRDNLLVKLNHTSAISSVTIVKDMAMLKLTIGLKIEELI